MQILFSFNHDASVTNEAYLINGKTLKSILDETEKSKQNEIHNSVEKFLTDNENKSLSDKKVIRFAHDTFKDNLNDLIIAAMWTGIEMFRSSVNLRLNVAFSLMSIPKASMAAEDLINRTVDSLMDRKDVHITDEFVLATKMSVVGMYHELMNSLSKEEDRSPEKCMKCASTICPIRMADYVDPVTN